MTRKRKTLRGVATASSPLGDYRYFLELRILFSWTEKCVTLEIQQQALDHDSI